MLPSISVKNSSNQNRQLCAPLIMLLICFSLASNSCEQWDEYNLTVINNNSNRARVIVQDSSGLKAIDDAYIDPGEIHVFTDLSEDQYQVMALIDNYIGASTITVVLDSDHTIKLGLSGRFSEG